MRSPDPGAGPGTHHEFFAGLLAAGVSCLVTGATALTLHGVPRLTTDIDLVVDPDPANVGRLERLLSAWGYGRCAPAQAPPAAVSRFRHPTSALGEIDVVLPPPGEFARLRAGSSSVTLVDVAIPLVGAADLQALKAAAGDAAGLEDAEGLAMLAAVRAGGTEGDEGHGSDAGWEQIRKFSRWSVDARCDWLLSAARLRKGLAPEARPMTRGLVRRRGWTSR